MARREFYKHYVIEIIKVPNDCWQTTITRQDGNSIKIMLAHPGEEQSSITNQPRHSEEEALEEAKRMIDAGGMD